MTAPTTSSFNPSAWAWVVIILAILGFGASLATNNNSSSEASAAKASAPDPRDQQIKTLASRIAELEKKPVQHHYKLRSEGLRTFLRP